MNNWSKKFRKRNKQLVKIIEDIKSNHGEGSIQIYLYRSGFGWFPDLQLSIEDLKKYRVNRPVRIDFEIETQTGRHFYQVQSIESYFIL